MCRHCEEEQRGQTRKSFRNYIPNRSDDYLRRYKEGRWTLEVDHYGNGHTSMGVLFCPWCGRDLQVPKEARWYISLDERVADLEFAVKKLEKAQKENQST